MTTDKAKQIRETLNAAMKEGTEVIASILDVMEENPELKELTIQLGKEYADVIAPTIQEFFSAAAEARADSFKKFKAMGLSDELAVKMACGR